MNTLRDKVVESKKALLELNKKLDEKFYSKSWEYAGRNDLVSLFNHEVLKFKKYANESEVNELIQHYERMGFEKNSQDERFLNELKDRLEETVPKMAREVLSLSVYKNSEGVILYHNEKKSLIGLNIPIKNEEFSKYLMQGSKEFDEGISRLCTEVIKHKRELDEIGEELKNKEWINDWECVNNLRTLVNNEKIPFTKELKNKRELTDLINKYERKGFKEDSERALEYDDNSVEFIHLISEPLNGVLPVWLNVSINYENPKKFLLN